MRHRGVLALCTALLLMAAGCTSAPSSDSRGPLSVSPGAAPSTGSEEAPADDGADGFIQTIQDACSDPDQVLSDLREAGFPTVDMKDTFGVRWYTMCIVEPNTDVLYLMNPSAGDSFKDVGWYQNYSKKTSANEHSYNVYFFEAHAAVVMYEASPLHSGESLATRLKKLNGWTVAHVFPPNA